MRIVFIQKSTGRGGAKNSLLESIRVVDSEKFARISVLAGEDGPFVGRCRALGVPCDLVKLPEWRKFFDRLGFAGAIRQIARGLEGEKVDWVISNEMWWGPHASTLARHLGCRSAVILRDGIATVKKSLQYRLHENDLILPVSSTIARGLSAEPRLAGRTKVLFNSVSVPPGGGEKEILERKLMACPDVRRWLLVVGKVGSRKNQADAVKITRSLIEAGHRDLGLILAGDVDPAYEQELGGVIKSCGMQDRVAVLGDFGDLESLFGEAEAVLLTSFREGLPRSLVEAILAGVPAFSYPCEGVDDIYGDDLDRFCSVESKPDDLFQRVRRALENPAETAEKMSALKARTEARFSPQAHASQLMELLS